MTERTSERVRAPDDGTLRLTRWHLGALGLMVAAIASLTFILGWRFGRGSVESASEAAQAGFTPDPEAQKALELLLHEVELAQAARPPQVDANNPNPEQDLAFPATLGGAAAGPAEPQVAAEGSPGLVDGGPSEGPPRPAPGTTSNPAAGWAVQVGSYASAAEADARIQALLADGFAAYRLDAFVDGQNWYRVRVGGFPTEIEAETQLGLLRKKVQDAELSVVVNP